LGAKKRGTEAGYAILGWPGNYGTKERKGDGIPKRGNCNSVREWGGRGRRKRLPGPGTTFSQPRKILGAKEEGPRPEDQGWQRMARKRGYYRQGGFPLFKEEKERRETGPDEEEGDPVKGAPTPRGC